MAGFLDLSSKSICGLVISTPSETPGVSKNPQKYFTNKSVELLR